MLRMCNVLLSGGSQSKRKEQTVMLTKITLLRLPMHLPRYCGFSLNVLLFSDPINASISSVSPIFLGFRLQRGNHYQH